MCQRPGAEIPPAAPLKRMIAGDAIMGGTRSRPEHKAARRRTQPEVHFRLAGGTSDLGRSQPCGQIGPIRPDVELADVAQRSALTMAAALRRLLLAVPWLPICVATLYSRANLPSTGLMERAGQRLLHEGVLAHRMAIAAARRERDPAC